MAYEKKKILLRRVVLGILLLIGIIVPICLANKTVRTSASGIVIKEDSGNVIDYYQYTDVSACKIELIFNMPVESVYAEVAFYDENNVFLAKEEQEFFGEDDRVSSTFYIDGQVDSYEIISYYCESHNDIVAREFVPIAFIPIDIILFTFSYHLCFYSVKFLILTEQTLLHILVGIIII